MPSDQPGARARPSGDTVGDLALRRTAQVAATWGLVWLGLLLLALLVWQLRVILALVFLAILLSAALRRPVDGLERLRLPRVAAVLTTYLVLLAILALVAWLVVPPLVEQAAELIMALPETAEQVLGWVSSSLAPLIPGNALERMIEDIPARLGEAIPDLQSVLAVPLVVIGVLVNLVVVVFLSAFLVLDGGGLWRTALDYLEPDRRERLTAIGHNVVDKLGSYVAGQLVVMAVTGVGVAVGMLIFGVPFVVPLAFLAFLAEAIPIAGPFISGVPIVLIAFLEGPITGLLMAGWIFALQQLEGYVLIPLVQNKAIQVSPTIIILGVVAGATLGGVLGAVIAIPLIAVVQVVMSEVVLPERRRSWQRSEGQQGAAPTPDGGDG